jgi:hypothetical protein
MQQRRRLNDRWHEFHPRVAILQVHEQVPGLLEDPAGCQKSAWPVSCDDDQGQPSGIMMICVLSANLFFWLGRYTPEPRFCRLLAKVH